jgi:hypothetical protein
MDGVFDNTLGPAIGGAVGVGAWLVGETVKGVTNVVDTVVDLVQGNQSSPYEEWLTAPVPTQETTNDFRNKANETTDTGLTAAEIISATGVQETKTGTSSPNSGGNPENLVPLVPQQNTTDPQAPLTQDFVPPPQKTPPSTAGQNVLLDLQEGSVVMEPCDGCEYLGFYPIYNGVKGAEFSKPHDRMIFSAEPEVDELGERMWRPTLTASLRGAPVRRWTWDKSYSPPKSGLLRGIGTLPYLDLLFDWFDSAEVTDGGYLRTYSLSEPVAPPPIEVPLVDPPIEQNEFPVLPDVFQPLPTVDVPNTFTPPIGPNTTPYVPSPVIPPAVPTLPNNPTSFPQIGNDGKIILPPSQIPTTAPDVHVINGTPVNSGAIRNDISGVAKEVGRIEQKAAQILNKVGNGPGDDFNWTALWLAMQALAELFEQPLPSKTFTIEGVCEEPLEDGRQPSTSVILPPEKYADRLISLGDVVPDLLQAHLGYKTPTCSTSRPPVEGDWVTTRWLSDEKMDHSDRRLRKLFRYRSKSSRDLVQLSGYWECFSWRAGPVCVIHKGAWWGTPQVWAESAEEGKRVIRHAAAEAGLDPDQVGRWAVSGSRSPRNGMSGTMRIHVHKGFPWVASRDGASWPNYLAKEV